VNLLRLFEQHSYWQEIKTVIDKLISAGHQTLLAGGCVRDGLLGVRPKDFDIATSALPDQVKALFPEALDVGREFGVMILPRKFGKIEVTTFRQDGDYLDGRRPTAVTFCSAEEDAKRRDYTINALFYDTQTGQVLDYVGGLKDLSGKIIRAVGDPQLRFTEDKLRLLRAVRFSAQLNFQIEMNTLAAVGRLASGLAQVSRERITDELRKLVFAAHLDVGFLLLKDTGLWAVIWPQLLAGLSENSLVEAQRVSHRLAGLGSLPLWLAALEVVRGSGGARALVPTDWAKTQILLSRDEKKIIQQLVKGYEFFKTLEGVGGGGVKSEAQSIVPDSEAPHRQAQHRQAQHELLLLLDDQVGPLLTEMTYAMADIGRLGRGVVDKQIDHYLQLSSGGQGLPAAFLNGDDLIALGFKADARMGQVLKELYMKQLSGEINSREAAEDFARALTLPKNDAPFIHGEE